jgi:hypothetical protein
MTCAASRLGLLLLLVGSGAPACGTRAVSVGSQGSGGSEGGSGGAAGAGGGGDGAAGNAAPRFTELWYSSGGTLVYIQISPKDGSVVRMVGSPISGLDSGQDSITMLSDGSLVLLRLHVPKSTFYHVMDPPRDGRAARATVIGVMPNNIMLEALYTDCQGRLYAMDTGVDVGTAQGNRLLRFTGDYLHGDFAFKVVSSLFVPDMDDMGPGISADGKITDNPGFAIDSGAVYNFDYMSGTGTKIGMGGNFGIHALGEPLFEDGKARLYVLSEKAELFHLDTITHAISAALGTGPAVVGDTPGHSGLTGPLTDCASGFIVQ